MLTDDDLDAIAQRCNAASPGPWKSYARGSRDHTSGSNFIRVGTGESRRADIELSGASTADQDFIAHARVDVERLVAEVLRLRARLNALGEKIAKPRFASGSIPEAKAGTMTKRGGPARGLVKITLKFDADTWHGNATERVWASAAWQ